MHQWHIEHTKECESTNNLLKQYRLDKKLDDKTAIMTDFQSGGRGQGTNIWCSELEKNLLCSLYMKLNIKADKYFLITIATSLAVYDLLGSIGIISKIKWPNDIYVGDKKIAGILIENSLVNDLISDTIIGVGLNINQSSFPEWIPNPVSLCQLTDKRYSPRQMLEMYVSKLESNISRIITSPGEDLYHHYIELLYGYKRWKIYETGSRLFNGQIHGILPDGKLLIETEGGQMKHFTFGEIRYVLK